MSAATTVRVCACGHPERLHSDEYGCDNTSCGCTTFRPGVAGHVVPARPAASSVRVALEVTGSRVEQLLTAGKASTGKGTVALAEKIEREIVDLLHQVTRERELAAANRDVERLERELAEARAHVKALKGRTPPRGQGRGPRLHPRRLRPHVRHQPGPRHARAARTRRVRPAGREGRVSA